jgi:hypothetical protein
VENVYTRPADPARPLVFLDETSRRVLADLRPPLPAASPALHYAAFPPAEARRLADKPEIHHMPKHGSWLNIAEIELSVLQRQCLNGRLQHQPTIEREVAACAAARN